MPIDSAKIIIHDTVYIKGADALDLLNKTDEFYTNAWNRLTVVLILGSVVIPAVIAWFQNRQLSSNKRKLSKIVTRETEQAKSEIMDWTKTHVEGISKEYDKKVDFVLNKSNTGFYFALGEVWLMRGNFRIALGMIATSLQYAIKADDRSNVISALQRLRLSILPEISQDDIAFWKDKFDFKTIIENIRNMEVDYKIVEEIELFEKSLKEVKDEKRPSTK